MLAKQIKMYSLLFILGSFLTACEGSFELSDPIINAEHGTANNAKTTQNSETNNRTSGTNNLTSANLDGEGLYLKYCAVCHGTDAKGTAIWSGTIEGYSPIENIILDGRGTMAAIAISGEETEKIQTYLLTLGVSNELLDGEGLYTRYCLNCHGVDALGGENWPGSIQAQSPIGDIVKNGRKTMDAIELEEKFVDKIQEYLLSLGEPLSELDGVEVYERLCLGCHGVKGEGTDRGMQLRYDDFAFSRFWTRSGRSKTGRFALDMPAYPATISEQQLTEIFEYIDSEPHPVNGQGLYLQYCANCHGANANGGPSGEGIAGSNDNFTGVIREGKGGSNYSARRSYMTAWDSGQLSGDEIQKIMTYTRGL